MPKHRNRSVHSPLSRSPYPQNNRSPSPPTTTIFTDKRPDSITLTRHIYRSEQSSMTPYSRAFLIKSLGITREQWKLFQDTLLGYFEEYPDFHALSGSSFCARLNEIGLPDGFDVGDESVHGHAYFMYHAALYAQVAYTETSERAEVAAIDRDMTGVLNQSVQIMDGIKNELDLCRDLVKAFRPGRNYEMTKQSIEISKIRLAIVMSAVNGITPTDLIPVIQRVIGQCEAPAIRDMRDFLTEYLESLE